MRKGLSLIAMRAGKELWIEGGQIAMRPLASMCPEFYALSSCRHADRIQDAAWSVKTMATHDD
jgi:hypothetical protein